MAAIVLAGGFLIVVASTVLFQGETVTAVVMADPWVPGEVTIRGYATQAEPAWTHRGETRAVDLRDSSLPAWFGADRPSWFDCGAPSSWQPERPAGRSFHGPDHHAELLLDDVDAGRFRTTITFEATTFNGEPMVWSPHLPCPFPVPYLVMQSFVDDHGAALGAALMPRQVDADTIAFDVYPSGASKRWDGFTASVHVPQTMSGPLDSASDLFRQFLQRDWIDPVDAKETWHTGPLSPEGRVRLVDEDGWLSEGDAILVDVPTDGIWEVAVELMPCINPRCEWIPGRAMTDGGQLMTSSLAPRDLPPRMYRLQDDPIHVARLDASTAATGDIRLETKVGRSWIALPTSTLNVTWHGSGATFDMADRSANVSVRAIDVRYGAIVGEFSWSRDGGIRFNEETFVFLVPDGNEATVRIVRQASPAAIADCEFHIYGDHGSGTAPLSDGTLSAGGLNITFIDDGDGFLGEGDRLVADGPLEGTNLHIHLPDGSSTILDDPDAPYSNW